MLKLGQRKKVTLKDGAWVEVRGLSTLEYAQALEDTKETIKNAQEATSQGVGAAKEMIRMALVAGGGFEGADGKPIPEADINGEWFLKQEGLFGFVDEVVLGIAELTALDDLAKKA